MRGDGGDLDAGEFSAWVTELRAAIRGQRSSDVACDGCTACCTSYQFVHIGPDEADTLAHIPPDLLFPAPRLPAGHVLLGYDEQGRCPMLGDHGCSIYEHRPRTCRTYDCRVFPATGLAVDRDDSDKKAIAERAVRWRFGLPTADDRARRAAVRAAAAFLGDQCERFPEGLLPSTTTQLAVLAVEIHETFLEREPDVGEVVAAVSAWVAGAGDTV